ncbi:MAG TPA: DUF3558 domain-containing protein [Actinophytocola sp.]|uniref:DUF3558 domain-containing protein n=1 Tax=Actinophytocola sp. TaxID=1872138 RepID=UPI002E008AC2|nr:DUF3558 domain-containing protein [Actinophytocola sp.]
MWVVAGVIAVAAGGCSSAVGGLPISPSGSGTERSTPPPGSSSGGSSPSEDNTYGAPRVSHPLDASRFLSRPCEVLTPAQLSALGVSKPGKASTTGAIAEQVGPSCAWTADREVDSTIGVGFVTGNKHGLSDTYRGRPTFAYFEETTVDGYPAVFEDGVDSRPSGACNITVGISDTLTFGAGEVGGRKGQASCDRAKQVAGAVIVTLKAGG